MVNYCCLFVETLFLGLIVSGGYRSDTSVEIILEDGTGYSLPDLPAPRYLHTMNGLLICGGGSYSLTSSTCTTLSDTGSWVTSHTLAARRRDHVSWDTGDGTLLLGGEDYDAYKSSELLSTTTSNSSLSFTLPYSTS